MDRLALTDDVCFGTVELGIETGPEAKLPPKTIAKINFPTLMLLDKATPDGRQFAAQGFDARSLPLSILYKDKTTDAPGHAEAKVVGSLRSVDVQGGNVSGWGYLADLPAAHECLTALETFSIRGVSADLTEVEVAEPSQGDLAANSRLRWIGTTSKLSALTFVPIPAFPDAYGEVAQDRPLGLVASGRIVRSIKPPASCFDRPRLDGPTGIVVTKDNLIFGHLATFDQCHVGIAGRCETIPRDDDFSYFYNGGGVLCDDGTFVRTGRIFMGGDHADPFLNGASALDHYAATSLAWADVRVGYDDYGIWVAGCTRPKLSEHLQYQARASAISGDWRPEADGKRHLYAVLSVNGPGFPIRETTNGALIASGPQPKMIDHVQLETAAVQNAAATADAIASIERLFPDVDPTSVPTALAGVSNQDHAGLCKLLRSSGFKVLVGRNGAGRAELAGAAVRLGPAPSGLRWDPAGRAPGIVPTREVQLALPAWGEALVNVSRATIEVAIAVAGFVAQTQPGPKLTAKQSVLDAVAARDTARAAVFANIDPPDPDGPPSSDWEIATSVLGEQDELMDGLSPVIAQIQSFEVVPTPVIPVRA